MCKVVFAAIDVLKRPSCFWFTSMSLTLKLSYLLMILFSIPKSQMFMMSAVYSNKTFNTLSCWAATWQMNFNLTKCNIMSITRSPLKFPAGYRLCNSPLESIPFHKYLGVFIQDNLEWDSHVKSVKHKAMKILGLLRRNFSGTTLSWDPM